MKQLIEQLVADFGDRVLPEITHRDLAPALLPGKADVLIGMRRTGKTTALLQMIGDLEARGVGRNRILYLNFEDERLVNMGTEALQWIPEAFFRLHPDAHGQECWFLFDEIHVVHDWELFIRRLQEERTAHIVLTGSSSRMLSTEIATSMRGRSLSTEVFPFSFSEFQRHHGGAVAGPTPGAAARAALEHQFSRYLVEGGFPEVQGLSEELRRRILQDYVDVVLLRDVAERHAVSQVTVLRALVRFLLSNPGGLWSATRFYNDLKSRGMKLGRSLLYDLISHLEDAYLLFFVPIFSRSERQKASNAMKVYPIDPGLARANLAVQTADRGHLLETTVFLHLRRQSKQISYYRTASGKEVDFAVTDSNGQTSLVQACLTVADPVTLKRELAALDEAMAELGRPGATIVTLTERAEYKLPHGTVEAVPAWWWCGKGN